MKGVDNPAILCAYPDSRQAALGSPGFRQVRRICASIDGAGADWCWYDGKRGRVVMETAGKPMPYGVIGVSVPYEMLYGDTVRMLVALGIEPDKTRREPTEPVVIAGGAASTINPVVAGCIADISFAGEAESTLPSLISALRENNMSGAVQQLTPMAGTHVSVYVQAAPDTFIESSQIDSSLDVRFDDPAESAFSGAGLVEVGRGCGRGCRFCAAGHMYLPPRNRPVGDILADVETYRGTADRIGLVGAAISDHPRLKEIMYGILDRGFGLTTSSFRADMIDHEMVGLLERGGLKTVTIAPECGSQRARDIVNKRLTDDDIMNAAQACADSGMQNLKLYYMIGVPWERDEDIAAIIEQTGRIRDIFPNRIAVSINPFIPKPQTPFQWAPMADRAYLEKVMKRCAAEFRRMSRVSYNMMSARSAIREAVISLGDVNVGLAVISNSRDGVAWKKALRDHGVDVDWLVHSEKPDDYIFPWDEVSGGKRKAALRASFEGARAAALKS